MSPNRLSEIDITRGLVMVLMALDHTRDFFGDHSIDALDVIHTSVPLFFARWLTHLCAPTFVFLAGISGPMVCFMALASYLSKVIQQALIVLGRVPLFFYLAHIVLIHVLAVLLAFLRFGHAEWLYRGPGIFWSETLPGHPLGYGLGLGWVVGIWLLVIVLLWPVCRWYGLYKQSHSAWWLRYL
jgi:hypothetical protein